MDTALVGLLGIVVGGLLAGAVNQYADAAKRRKNVHAVGVLVASELKRALHAIDYAVDHHGPTPPEVNITTPIWQDRGEALAVDVHPEVWQNLDEAYAAIEVLNKHAANIKEDIPNNAGAIVFTARKMLADDLDRIPPNRGPRRAMRFWTKLAAYSVVAALLILGVSSLVAHERT